MPPSLKPTDAQRDAAALWLARRTGGSLSSGEQRELDTWLNADPLNRQAWDEMRVLWARLEEPARRVSRRSSPRSGMARRLSSPAGWAAAASAGAAMVAAVWIANPTLIQNMQADVVSGQHYVTPVTLPDGSVATVGADTALVFRFDATRRHVRLLRGAAFFDVVHGSAPAFTIDVDGDAVRVVGTRFTVDRTAADTRVVVEEGEVAVSGARDRRTHHVLPGQQVAVHDGATGDVEDADLSASLAWMSGRLVVHQSTVSEVVATLARHSTKSLVVRGGIAGKRISGTFPLDDIDGSLGTIAAAVNATVIQSLPLVTVLF